MGLSIARDIVQAHGGGMEASNATGGGACLRFTLPLYVQEGKAYLTIAVGCTGGRHRSVVLTEELGRLLRQEGHEVSVRHRDVDRAP